MEYDATHYDSYSRTGPKIFVGEWATREGQPTTNMNAALGDAAWMSGMERNSDLVVMSCYAPLFVNVNPGGMQWKSDLVGYDAITSYGSPSYYVQKMFSQYLGDVCCPSPRKIFRRRPGSHRLRRTSRLPRPGKFPQSSPWPQKRATSGRSI